MKTSSKGSEGAATTYREYYRGIAHNSLLATESCLGVFHVMLLSCLSNVRLCSLPDELPFTNTILQEISLKDVSWVFAITNIEHCIRPDTFVLIVRYMDRSLSSICFCIVYTLGSHLSPKRDFLPPLHCPVHH